MSYVQATLNPCFSSTYVRYQAAFARLGVPMTSPSGDGFIRALHVGGRVVPYGAEAHLLNTAAASVIARDKLASYQVLLAAGLSVPDGTAFFAPSSKGIALQVPDAALVDRLDVSGLGERIVVKPGMEAQGRGVYICVGMDEVRHAAIEVLKLGHYGLAQAYVAGPEYRVALLGSEVLVCYTKRGPRLRGTGTVRERIHAYNASSPKVPLEQARFVDGAWGLDDTPPGEPEIDIGVANLSRGGVAELEPPPPEILDVALRAQAAIGLHHSGVDLRWPDRSRPPVVLEVNSNPGFEVLGKSEPALMEAIVGRIAAAIVERLSG